MKIILILIGVIAILIYVSLAPFNLVLFILLAVIATLGGILAVIEYLKEQKSFIKLARFTNDKDKDYKNTKND